MSDFVDPSSPDVTPLQAVPPLPGVTSLQVVSWNVASVNNNPFEYWITMKEHPAYNQLMIDVENFIEAPGDNDVEINTVFTDEMFTSLEARFTGAGWEEHKVKVRAYWERELRTRKIISGFMKDKSIGNKRLASMPDRYTNTIDVVGSPIPACRPTVINMYEGDLGTMSDWWKQWTQFMFETPLTVRTKKGPKTLKVYELLAPIESTKYPAITLDEEKISIPLQVVAIAIFDAILVHMLNVVSEPGVWQPIKRDIISSLVKNKVPEQLAILAKQYSGSDIICLQEVSASFVDEAKVFPPLSELYFVVSPANIDAARDQNSVILLSKTRFPEGSSGEITHLLASNFDEGVKSPVSDGDLLMVTATDSLGDKYVIASFHGDSAGLATIPVLKAMNKIIATTPALVGHNLIFGLDANTHEKGDKDKAGVEEFGTEYLKFGYSSNWGDVPIKDNYTTYKGRTYLQTQLNKACKNDDKTCFDKNPKDFILFDKKGWTVTSTLKDNTGNRAYTEGMPFPTLDWPSDHGLVWVELTKVLTGGRKTRRKHGRKTRRKRRRTHRGRGRK